MARRKGSRKILRRNRPKIRQKSHLKDANSRVIGTSDIAFVDSSVSGSSSWTRKNPIDVKREKNKGMPSLKRLCAEEMARNVDCLNVDLLRSVPARCWNLVWRIICESHGDSFKVFSIFAAILWSHNDFRAHWKPKKHDLRSDALTAVTIPNFKRHRIENVGNDIILKDFIKTLNDLSYSPLVLIDFSDVSPRDMILLLNTPGLMGITLDNSSVDDLFIYNLVNCIEKEGKLRMLTILSLVNCRNITKSSIRELLRVASRVPCSLALVETDIGFDQTQIEGTKWIEPSDDSATRVMRKCPLGLKLHMLYKLFHTKILTRESHIDNALSLSHLHRIQNRIILDFMVHPHTKQAEKCWRSRLASRERGARGHCYIRDNNIELRPDDIVARPHNQSRKRQKPIIRNVNAKSYFSI